jgi:hypothetical protein
MGMGFNTVDACVKGVQTTCSPAHENCPDPINTCIATTTRENYTSCCRPQPYANLNQTWKQQGKFDL